MTLIEWIFIGCLVAGFVPAWRAGVNLAAFETEETASRRRRYTIMYLGIDIAVAYAIGVVRACAPAHEQPFSLVFPIIVFTCMIGHILLMVGIEAVSARS